MTTLNIIGCGNVGKTLARVWTQHAVLKVQGILNRSLASGRRAAEFVGSGRAVQSYDQLEKSDLVMISASDEAIAACCEQLCRARVLQQGVIVFHCSGALGSSVLEPAKEQGAWIASLHPVQSFADTARAAATFAGTYCALEGDAEACETLRGVLVQCGAIPFSIQAESKTLYHAATVMVCNYLVALMEVGLRCFQQAGLSRDTALKLVQPIVSGTIDNLFALGPVRALSGPIARGEASVVAGHCEALGRWNPDIQRIYQDLGRVALDLAIAQGNASAEGLAAIRKLFEG